MSARKAEALTGRLAWSKNGIGTEDRASPVTELPSTTAVSSGALAPEVCPSQ